MEVFIRNIIPSFRAAASDVDIDTCIYSIILYLGKPRDADRVAAGPRINLDPSPDKVWFYPTQQGRYAKAATIVFSRSFSTILCVFMGRLGRKRTWKLTGRSTGGRLFERVRLATNVCLTWLKTRSRRCKHICLHPMSAYTWTLVPSQSPNVDVFCPEQHPAPAYPGVLRLLRAINEGEAVPHSLMQESLPGSGLPSI